MTNIRTQKMKMKMEMERWSRGTWYQIN